MTMKNKQDVIMWLSFHVAIFTGAFAGFYLKIEGAERLTLFLAWTWCWVTMVLVGSTKKRHKPLAPKKLEVIVAAFLIVILVWNSHVVTAAVYLLLKFWELTSDKPKSEPKVKTKSDPEPRDNVAGFNIFTKDLGKDI